MSRNDMLFEETSYSDDEDICPICCEEMDVVDRNCKPCPCGYQLCQFCYNNIKTNPELNGKCPGCRRTYDDKFEYKPMTTEEVKAYKANQERKKREKKELERQKREAEQAKRHHLANVRVIQKNLVYVLGLNPPVPYDDLPQVFRSDKYFGQFGRINKVVINKRTTPPSAIHNNNTPGYSVYVTFSKKEDASKCIESLDGAVMDGRVLKAAHGTTKYCSSYLRGQTCQNPNCMFLHEPGEEVDPARPDSTRFHNNHTTSTRSSIPPHFENTTPKTNSPLVSTSNLHVSTSQPSSVATNEIDSPALPATVSWATSSQQNLNTHSNNTFSNNEASTAFPTLGDVLQQQHNQQSQKSSGANAKSKKDKKDKDQDKKQIILDETVAAFKNLSETLQSMKYEMKTNYTIKDKYKRTLPINLFEDFDLDSFENSRSGYLQNTTDKAAMVNLVDTYLMTPKYKNYTYRALLEARAAAHAQMDALAHAQQLKQNGALFSGAPGLVGNTQLLLNGNVPQVGPGSDVPRSFPTNGLLSPAELQARLNTSRGTPTQPYAPLNTASFLQQRLQQNAPNSIRNNIGAPPGLMENGTTNKSNSQELLNQLMNNRKTMG